MNNARNGEAGLIVETGVNREDNEDKSRDNQTSCMTVTEQL